MCDDSDATRTHSQSQALTWTAGVDYQAAEKTLLYFTSRRGYRAGGINAPVGSIILPEYSPEYVLDFELGIKSDWQVAGRALRTNAAVFYQDYTDIQVTRGVFIGSSFQTITDNAAKAELWGGEFEALLKLTDNLELSANASYLNVKYTEFSEGVSAATIADLKTREKGNPDWKYGVSARYRLPFDQQERISRSYPTENQSDLHRLKLNQSIPEL